MTLANLQRIAAVPWFAGRTDLIGGRSARLPTSSSICAQPFAQLRPAPTAGDVAYGDSDGLLLTDQHDQSFAAGKTGVKRIPLQHGVMLRKAAAETTLAIAADPKRLGARIGITAVLHTWGSAMTHHPHVHMIVPGGGLSLDGARWVAARANFLVHVNVLARLFRGKMLAMLMDAHRAGQLKFFNSHAGLADKRTFKRFLAPLRRIKWVVYCKAPFAGPKQVLRYLSRYTHRVAISNRRLVAADDGGVSFRWKDYRIEGPGRWKTMTLAPHEFIRRFLIHVLPKGFHRIRHYGLFANGNRAESIAKARELLAVATPQTEPEAASRQQSDQPRVHPRPCPCCGGRMIVIEVFARGGAPSHKPSIDTSWTRA